MTDADWDFQVGRMYSNVEISSHLGVGNAGGIRLSVGDDRRIQRIVLLTSVPGARIARENPYHDRIEGNVLVYTGTGRTGDQKLVGRNLRIVEQQDKPFPIYGFLLVGSRRDRNIGAKRWRFPGLLEYLRHYLEDQLGTDGTLRQTWMFEMRIHDRFGSISPQHDFEISSSLASDTSSYGLDEEDRQVVPSHDVFKQASIASAMDLEGVRSRLLAHSPEQFEHLVKDVLVGTGLKSVSVTRYSQDGGIDVDGYLPEDLWPVAGLHVQVQAKRWLRTVGRKEVASLRGSLTPYARGCLVTTSQFSKAALIEATGSGKNPIALIDGIGLAAIILRTQVPLG
jgi:HJR/Mrr/RecB family endonuclease